MQEGNVGVGNYTRSYRESFELEGISTVLIGLDAFRREMGMYVDVELPHRKFREI